MAFCAAARARIGAQLEPMHVAAPALCASAARFAAPRMPPAAAVRRLSFLRATVATPRAQRVLLRPSAPAASFAAAAAAAAAGAGDSAMVFYKLTVDGEEVDSNIGRQAMEVKLGSGGVIPGFDAALMGMVRAAIFLLALCANVMTAAGRRRVQDRHDRRLRVAGTRRIVIGAAASGDDEHRPRD